MKPSAVFLDALTIGNDISLQELHDVSEIDIYDQTDTEDVIRLCHGKAVIITNKIIFDRSLLHELSDKLRLICLTATGYNNIDVDAATELGILVCNVRDYSTDSVAQHTFNLCLNLLQQTDYYHRYIAEGEYSQAPVFTHFGRPWFELSGKTWGIIGMGAIGKRTAEIASAFGCRIIYYSSSGMDRTPEYCRHDLHELLKESDIISIHAPLTEKTNGLIGLKELRLMQKDSLIINVGRGGIIKENDLAAALREGIIRGAAVDVFTNEPLEQESSLLDVPEGRLLLSPHIAWGSTEARQRVIAAVAGNIRAYAAGHPVNTV
ncbi:NAD(P)-dependent oxidoreductase [Spirochaeta dissipatitropha]